MSAQPCIPPGSLNRVLALAGWGKGLDVTSARWHVEYEQPFSGERGWLQTAPSTYLTRGGWRTVAHAYTQAASNIRVTVA